MMWGTSFSSEEPDSRGETTPGGYPANSRTRTPTMPSKGKTDKTLTLKLEGDEVPAERFVRSVSAFLGLVSDVADNVTHTERAFRWLVGVRAGSLIVDFRPVAQKAESSFIPTTIRAINDGVELLEKRAERPLYWSDVALKRAKELADLVDPTTRGVEQIMIRADRSSRRVTRRTSAHVEALIGTEVKALGTIEGRLRTVTEGGGLHIVVQDALTLNNIRCYIKDEQTEELLGAFRRRVAVYGEVRYRKDGQPLSIDVQEFRILKEQHELPKAKDVRGILSG
jgi:hypothetical protein